jgi:hypothetical protein
VYLQAQILVRNSKHGILALVDSGSEVTLITRKAVKRMALTEKLQNCDSIDISGPNNAPQMSSMQMLLIHIVCTQAVSEAIPVPAYVVDALHCGRLDNKPAELILNAEISCNILSGLAYNLDGRQEGPCGYIVKGSPRRTSESLSIHGHTSACYSINQLEQSEIHFLNGVRRRGHGRIEV